MEMDSSGSIAPGQGDTAASAPSPFSLPVLLFSKHMLGTFSRAAWLWVLCAYLYVVLLAWEPSLHMRTE